MPRTIALVICLLTMMLGGVASQAAERPNVIVILADDMGWSDLGCYGGEIETPNLDALAADGVQFTQFYNTARCCPTRASLLTGLYSHQAGIGHMVADDGIPSYQGYLNDRCLTIGEAMQAAGYATSMTGKWHVGSERGHWPLDRGFEQYWGSPSGGGVYFKDTMKVRTNVFFTEGNKRIEVPDDMYVTDEFTTRAMQFIEDAVEKQKKPFFLYLAHIAPHWPLQAMPEDIEKYKGTYDVGWDVMRQRRFEKQKALGLWPEDAEMSQRDPWSKPWDEMTAAEQADLAHRMTVYAAQVDRIDQNIGRLVQHLQDLGQFDNTLLLFLSDNGCSAESGPGGFSRGREGAPIGTALSYASLGSEWANVSDTPFRKFKQFTHEGGISTPFIAHWPNGMKGTAGGNSLAGTRVDTPAHVIDIMPTVLDVAGADYPKEAHGKTLIPLEGHSLKPLITSAATMTASANVQAISDSARPLFWEHQGHKAIRVGDWKAVLTHGGDWELYNLAESRNEEDNLARQNPAKLEELKTQWQTWADRCGVWDWQKLQQHRRQRSEAN